MSWPHPLTHPTTHTPPMGGGVSTNHKSSNRTELSQLGQDSLNFYLFDLFSSINPPSHQTVHPPMDEGVSTDFKSSNRIELSWLVQLLLNFYWFWGSSWGVVGGWIGVGVSVGGWGVPHTHTHACMYIHVKHDIHDKHGCLHGGGHLQFLFMGTCACTCMCRCVETPPCLQMPPTHLPPPQRHKEPKTPKFNKSWTNQDISIQFEDSLPLNIPEVI